MINYEKVRSTVQPLPLVIDEFNVWVHTNIAEVNENIGKENEFIGYEYNMVSYTKDEYIEHLDLQLTNTQLALVEVYEMLIS